MNKIKNFSTLIIENNNNEKNVINKLSLYIKRRLNSIDQLLICSTIINSDILKEAVVEFYTESVMSEHLKDVKYVFFNLGGQYFVPKLTEKIVSRSKLCEMLEIEEHSFKDYTFNSVSQKDEITDILKMKELKYKNPKLEIEFKAIL